MNSKGPDSSSFSLGLVFRPVARTFSAPNLSRRTSVSSDPI